jgi:hypothetical protein
MAREAICRCIQHASSGVLLHTVHCFNCGPKLVDYMTHRVVHVGTL